MMVGILVVWNGGPNVELLRRLEINPWAYVLKKPLLINIVSILWLLAPYMSS
jgi:hypothetical protein